MAGLIFAGSASAAPRLYFNPAALSLQNGVDIQIDVSIDAETNAVFGADATINIPSEITVKSVTNGQFFDTFFNAPVTNGQLELHGYLSAAFASKTGNGTFARLTLTSSKTLGASKIGFVCSAGGTDTEILNAFGQNILGCSSLNQLTLTYLNSTASPSPTPGGGNDSSSNPTNKCGGTCGSNYNCNSGLFCYQGFCRNPFCQTDATCECKSTSTPKPTPRPTAKPNVKSTPIVIALSKFTPFPTTTPTGIPGPVKTPNASKSFDLKSLALYIGIGVLGIVILIVIIKILKRKGGPPKITPPTGSTDGQASSIHSYPVSPPLPPQSQI